MASNFKLNTFDVSTNRPKLRDSESTQIKFKNVQVEDLGSPVNYTAANKLLTTHLSGIDSALAAAAGTVFNENNLKIHKNGDVTALIRFDANSVGAGVEREIKMPNANVDLGLISTAVQSSLLGLPNGVAQLDASGKLPASQLTVSAMEYKGAWNASTNTPTLADGTGDTGDVYAVSTGGTRNLGSGNQTFVAGDWVIYNGLIWQKVENSTSVASVNGQTGIVVLNTDNIAEGTAKYFTDDRAKDAAGAALLDSAQIDFTYNSGTKQISATIIAASVTEVELNASVAGNGLGGGAGTALSVNVDDSTIEINSDALRVKDLGITSGKIADDAVGKAKINSDVAGKGLQQASDGALETNLVKSLVNDDVASFSAGEFGLIKANGAVEKVSAQTAGLNLGSSFVMALEAIASAASGKFAVGSYKLGGFSGLAEESPVYLSRATAGAFSQNLTSFVAGEAVVLLGQAVSETEISFAPQYIAEL